MIPQHAAVALQAAAVLASACAFDTPLRFAIGLPLVCGALVLAATSALAPAGASTSGHLPVVWSLIAAVSALAIVSPSTGGPDWYEWARRTFGAAGVIAVALVSGQDERWRRRAMAGSMALATLLAAVTPLATPHPQIDVVPWTAAAVGALLHGIHPYTVHAADVYRGGRDFGFVVRVYPYMPATLLVFAPFVAVLGDFRYALAACIPVTIWLLRRTGRASGADPRVVDAATLLFVLHPALMTVVRSGWNELLLCVAAAVLALAAATGACRAVVIAASLLPALKQYALAPAVLLLMRGGRVNVPAWALGGAVAGLTVLPFVLWNAPATLSGIAFQMTAPVHPRLTSMSIPGLLTHVTSFTLPVWVSAVTELGIALVLAARGFTTTPAGLFTASAVTLLATFLLGWQAFVNYYQWVGLLLLLGAVSDRTQEIRA